jgi:uncharacterized protein YycO
MIEMQRKDNKKSKEKSDKKTKKSASNSQKLLKKAYKNYTQGKKSVLRGGQAYLGDLPLSLNNIYNTSGLNIGSKDFTSQAIVRIPRAPFSNMTIA